MRLRGQILSFCIAIIGGAFGSTLMAQDVSWLRPADLQQQFPWLTSENASGLTVLPVSSRISEVGCYGEIFSGGLRNYNEAKNGYKWGLKGLSFYPISEHVTVWGEVDYSNFRGREMTGSYFIDPTQTPFNLVEFSEDNPGDKQLENYHLAGAVGLNLTRRLAGGLKFDYTAANYSKRKDLRHTNSLMDMSLTAGLSYRLAERLTIGANYAYRRRNESLLLSMFGTTDKLYYTLVDYGAFFGKRELFSDTGYTKENEAKPLFDSYHGGSLQLSWRIGTRWEWFNEVSYRTRTGFYGDDSPSTVVYSTHSGEQLAYNSQLVYTGLRSTHTLRVVAEQRKVENRENIYDFRNDEVGINYYVYLGDAEVGGRTEQNISLQYTARLDIEQGLPRWQIDIRSDFDLRKQKAVNYPDYRLQDIAWWELSSSLERNFSLGQGLFSARINLGYQAGTGDCCEDGKYNNSNNAETLTRTLDELLMRDYEYHTATRFQAGANARYARRMGQKGVRGYVELNYNFHRALNASYLGNAVRHIASLQIGCNF